MFGYYTTLSIITCSIIISAIIVIYNDTILEKLSKNIFMISYIMLLFVCIFEWLVVYLERINSPLHLITTFSMGLVLFLAPSITAMLTLGINDRESKWLNYVAISIVTFSFIAGFSGLFSDAIFYYDEHSIYHRGEYYAVHVLLVIFSALTLLINTLRLGIKYQNKNTYILFLNFIIFLGAMYAQFTYNGVWILWISYTISISFGYIYYSSFVNQIDVLTGILNRKCFDSHIYDIRSNAVLLIIDVNKFKEINDTHGHAAGDYCLLEIARAIKKVYGKSGYCYRVGGDEFCVLLYKNLDSLEELNSNFIKKISEKNYKLALPGVSIGYSYYYPNKSSIQKVIEEADAMMYTLKQNY